MSHSTQEGGSFVCKYGRNNVCPSLPIDGVNQDDYENHVEKCHIGLNGMLSDFYLKRIKKCYKK